MNRENNIAEFVSICKRGQKNLKKLLQKKLESIYSEVYTRDGFIFAKGDFPVLLVAHMDTVHKEVPQKISVHENEIISSPQGIGGDDRCGIYMILKIIERYNCSVLFTEDEEIGGIGANKFINSDIISFVPEINYMIEFDRMNGTDAVFYSCANDDFIEFITNEFYKEAYGTYSDISDLMPTLMVAGVNLSCGYYKAHTTKEYVVFSEMEKSIEAALKILNKTTENTKFDYVQDDYDDYDWCGWQGKKDYFNDGYYYMFEYLDPSTGTTRWADCFANSLNDAIAQFMINHQNVSYNMISAIYDERGL